MKPVFYFFYLFAISVSSQNFLVKNIPQELLENANSVMIDEKVDVNINDVDEIEISYHGIITVLNKNGDNHLLTAVFYDKERKVKSLELIVYDKNGEEIEKFKKRDFLDVSAVSNATLYSDSRALIIDYTPKSYPYTLEFNYTTVSEDTAFISPFFPISNFYSSTLKSEYTINVSQDLNLKYNVIDLEDQIKVGEQGNVFTFSVNNVKAIEYENHSPNHETFFPQVLFGLNQFNLKGVQGSAEDWNKFGIWMNNHLLQGVSDIPDATKNKIKNLVSGEPSLINRAKMVYNYMQENTRYISVQIGIGGWKPMKASEVDRLGYGDCKALTNYTKALLDIADVPSYYTIVYGSAEKRDILSDFTSMQGNHVILAVPNDEEMIWLECTSQQIPFGFIGDLTDDRDVLLITPEGGKISHTKKYEVEESKLYTNGEVALNSSGEIAVNVHLKSSGIQYDSRFSIERKDQDDRNDYYKGYWDYINNITIDSLGFYNDKENIEFNEHIKFKATSYPSSAGDKLIFTLNVLNRATFIPKRYKNRSLPLQISRGYSDIDNVKIIIPKDLDISNLPEPLSLETEFGSYFSKVDKLPDGNLLYTRELKIFDGFFPKESYKAYRSFRKEIAKLDKQKIILNKI